MLSLPRSLLSRGEFFQWTLPTVAESKRRNWSCCASLRRFDNGRREFVVEDSIN